MKLASSLLGVLLLILSFPIGILTPFIPVGLPIAVVGLVLIGRNSRTGRNMLVRTARRRPMLRQLYLTRLRPLLTRRTADRPRLHVRRSQPYATVAGALSGARQ